MKKHHALRQEAIRLRTAGASLPEICKATGKSPSTVWYWIGDIGPSPGKGRSGRRGRPLEEILVRDSTYTCFDRLKIRLLAEGRIENRCECGLRGLEVNAALGYTQGRVPIQLHHRNGVNNDHRIENLAMLCGNCHHCEHGWNERRSVHGAPLAGILVENSTYVNNTRLRDKLLTAGHFEDKCHACGLRSWRGNPIPLQLHHRNGVRSDNRPDNLDILCVNCHGLTDHWCGRFAGTRTG